jgi:hypothetical protein
VDCEPNALARVRERKARYAEPDREDVFLRSCWNMFFVVTIVEATVHKQWDKTKAQKPKSEHKTKDNQKLFSQQ